MAAVRGFTGDWPPASHYIGTMSEKVSLLKGGAGSKLQVVDKASLQFVETGRMKEDSWDIDWENTPEPAERTFHPPVQGFSPPLDRPAPAPRPASKPQPTAQPVPAKRTRSATLEEIPDVFHGVSPRQLHEALEFFDVFDVARGETLIQQGDKQPALLMVLRGQMEVSRYDRRRRASRGGVLGLTTLFGDGHWPVGLRTLIECRVMVLEIDGYRRLRSSGSVVSQALEEYALENMLQSLERTAKEVATYNQTSPIDELIPRKGFFERFAAAIGAGGISVVNIDVSAALSASPIFRNAEPHHLAKIADRMEAIRVQTGEFLFTQGEPSTHLYVVVSGSVGVIAAAGKNAAIKHETLHATDAFGAWSMLRTGGNWASYVALEKTTLLEMDKLGWTELSVSGDEVGSVLRLALIRSLASRVTVAHLQLAAHESGLKPTIEEYGDLEESKFVTINPASRR